MMLRFLADERLRRDADEREASENESEPPSSSDYCTMERFSIWLSTRGEKGRLMIMLSQTLEELYALKYEVRAYDANLQSYAMSVAFSMDFDVMTGNHDYLKIKAHFLVQLAWLSPYWRAIAEEFGFCTEQNGVGMEMDRMQEFIHKVFKHKNPTLGARSTFIRRLAASAMGMGEVKTFTLLDKIPPRAYMKLTRRSPYQFQLQEQRRSDTDDTVRRAYHSVNIEGKDPKKVFNERDINRSSVMELAALLNADGVWDEDTRPEQGDSLFRFS